MPSSAIFSASNRRHVQSVTGTLRLPLPVPPANRNELGWLRTRAHHLQWNPHEGVTGGDADTLRQHHRRIIDQSTVNHEDRVERYREFRRLSVSLRPRIQAQIDELKKRQDAAECDLIDNAILQSRDYAWILYPECVLRPFLQRFLGRLTAFADRLTAAVKAYGPLCVGLDPRIDSLPNALRSLPPADAYERFCSRVLELVWPFAGIVKPQAAFFEQLGADGFAHYKRFNTKPANLASSPFSTPSAATLPARRRLMPKPRSPRRSGTPMLSL